MDFSRILEPLKTIITINTSRTVSTIHVISTVSTTSTIIRHPWHGGGWPEGQLDIFLVWNFVFLIGSFIFFYV